MRPHALDANAINTFQAERLSAVEGRAHQRISQILLENCIALDQDGHCLQEWMDCAAGKFPFALSDWIADQFLSGKLRYFALAPNTCYKYLLKLGMPKKDHKWVRLAIGCGGKIIITDDVDFFDPSKKRSDAATKEKIKINGNGPCSKNLRLEYGVEVVTL